MKTVYVVYNKKQNRLIIQEVSGDGVNTISMFRSSGDYQVAVSLCKSYCIGAIAWAGSERKLINSLEEFQ